MPALFLGHGSPTNVLKDNLYIRSRQMSGMTLSCPKAIAVASTYWFTRGTEVITMETPLTIHDFGGFPQTLYDTYYSASGSPALAQCLVELLASVPVTLGKEIQSSDHGS